MANWRKSKGRESTDSNQKDIVKALRAIPGVSCEIGHDDILVGYKGRSYWYELKAKKPTPSQIKPDQYRIWETWTGHYRIIWELDQILEDIGI